MTFTLNYFKMVEQEIGYHTGKNNLIVGTSTPMKEIYKKIGGIVSVESPSSVILINGETGTGKALVSEAIHYKSPRCEKPFIVIDCATIPESILESELFGYVKGAFTGAIKEKYGSFIRADGGTIVLDGINNMSLASQAKLLSAVGEREIKLVGSDEKIKVNATIIVTTNRNLEKMVKEGQFRGDLFYRINQETIYLPPLRERRDDIALLFNYFLNKYPKNSTSVDKEAYQFLELYSWPGNVWELTEMVRKLSYNGGVVYQKDIINLIKPKNIHEDSGDGYSQILSKMINSDISLKDGMDAIKGFIINHFLNQKGWTQKEIADSLGKDRKTLRIWMRGHRIKKER